MGCSARNAFAYFPSKEVDSLCKFTSNLRHKSVGLNGWDTLTQTCLLNLLLVLALWYMASTRADFPTPGMPQTEISQLSCCPYSPPMAAHQHRRGPAPRCYSQRWDAALSREGSCMLRHHGPTNRSRGVMAHGWERSDLRLDWGRDPVAPHPYGVDLLCSLGQF
jgi:hypothetical protein